MNRLNSTAASQPPDKARRLDQGTTRRQFLASVGKMTGIAFLAQGCLPEFSSDEPEAPAAEAADPSMTEDSPTMNNQSSATSSPSTPEPPTPTPEIASPTAELPTPTTEHPSPTPTSTATTGEAVVLQQPLPEGTYLTIIDPATGRAMPDLNPSAIQAASAATGGYAGIIYASIERSGNTTEVLAMDVTSGEIETIGSIKTRAKVRAVAPDGETLVLATFRDGRDIASRLPVSGDPDIRTRSWRPDGLPSITIPERWRASREPGPTVAREMDAEGVVSQDGKRWYHLSGLGMSGLLYRAEFSDGGAPTITSLRVPSDYNHYSLIRAPDSQSLYVVDYSSAMTVHIIDGAELAVQKSIAMWDSGGTKGSPCSATLSPDGSQLYVIGINGPNGGGIDVIDMESLTLSGHFLSERPVTCMTASPDGRYLYATNLIGRGDRTLTTVDIDSGEEVSTVEVATDGPLFPLLATAPN